MSDHSQLMQTRSYKADITTVAQAAGVSPATVSRVLNHPGLVSPPTRRRVEEAIRSTGYIRNRFAQSMHGRRSATLGLVVPTVSYSIFAELVQSFNDALAEQDFTLLLASHGYDLDAEYRVLRKLYEHRVDGIALIGLDHAEDTFRLIASQDVPVVAVWSWTADSRLPCIGSDNAEAGAVAARHLLDLGHRRIGFVFPPAEENDRARARLEAARRTVAAAGCEMPDAWSARSTYSTSEAKIVCRDLLARSPRPEALICGNDVIAQGALAAATDLRIAVPEALSIVGIGDFPGSADTVPALSTVAIPAGVIGRRAGRHLIDCLGETAPEAPIRERFAVELHARATTAPPGG